MKALSGDIEGLGPTFAEAHTSPEVDPQLARAELDACRAEIERLRALNRRYVDALADAMAAMQAAEVAMAEAVTRLEAL